MCGQTDARRMIQVGQVHRRQGRGRCARLRRHPGIRTPPLRSKLECTTAGWDHRRARCSRAAALAYCTHA